MPFRERYPSYRAASARATIVALLALLGLAGASAEQREAKAAKDDKEAAAAQKDATAKPTEQSSVRPTDPPPALSVKQARGPDVTLIAAEERTVYEYRQNGKLRMIKVVPKIGKPYYLTPRDPTTGFGDLEQADTLVPQWILIEF